MLDNDLSKSDAIFRFENSRVTVGQVWTALRSMPNDLRGAGLTVAVHNDYMLDGKRHTFWLMTGQFGVEMRHGKRATRAFKGEGATDMEALDQIRAEFAEATDNHKHAPLCPANHYHGSRAPTGECTCGAVTHGVIMGAR